jgi:hypothetical protein
VSTRELAPSVPFLADAGDDVNESSIVVILHYRSLRELLMGDAGNSPKLAVALGASSKAGGGRPKSKRIDVS